MDFNKISKKWQKKWEEAQIFKAVEGSKKKKCYVLEMFPYPSGSGLHMGHACNYTIGDVYARYKRMNGFNVLYPMGYDSLGLPAENAAIKEGTHPQEYTEHSIKNFIRQQKELGLSYDWDRMVKTSSLEYYKWDQWIFLKMLEKGLAYKKKSAVNWCPKCSTALANEQVHDGKCWRHKDTHVEIKYLEQWYFKITEYAEELYDGIDKLTNWADDVKAMQKHWIGKSAGTEVLFEINGKKWPIFTTRPDTIFGVTFMVISAQHPLLNELVTKEQKKEVDEFLKKIKSTSEKDLEELEKEGAFTGSYAVNPMTNEKIPVYAGNFVVADYGSGMVMAVPAHDQRDFEFAKKYKIPIKVVIEPDAYPLNAEKMTRAFIEDGKLVNSSGFDGTSNQDAILEITKALEKKKLGKKVVQYKLRDWLLSRQRYWGTPIPIVYCSKCGMVPVPEKDLPIELPHDVKFGQGNPLATNKEFVNTKCPKCRGPATRETDTMDTFVNSSWYYLRYCDSQNKKELFDKKKVKQWMPIDIYIGGKEHACMHLIYFRFYTKFLRDLGLLDFDEPTYFLYNQGMLHGENGAVMSKSDGNVVLPEVISEKYGIDTARFFLMFMASPDKDKAWSDKGIQGSLKTINKVITLFDKETTTQENALLASKMHKTIINTTEKIEKLQYNLALIDIMNYIRFLDKQKQVTKQSLKVLLLLLAPFCPHICEELWEKIGEKPFIATASWPKGDPKKIDMKAETAEEMVYTTIADIANVLKLTNKENPAKIKLFLASPWKYTFVSKLRTVMEKTRNISEIMKEMMSDAKLKEHGKEVSALVPRLVKDPSKIPECKLDQKTEIEALEANKEEIESEFKSKVEIIKEEKTTEQKARNAMPGKPAIIVE